MGVGLKPSTATTAEAIGACFTAEGLAVAHHSFCSFDFALTLGVALALDEICRHGEYLVGTVLFYALRKLPNRGDDPPSRYGLTCVYA